MPPRLAGGPDHVHANYEGNPDYLLGTAPIYDLEPEAEQTALFAFVVPTLDIPIAIPVTVRTNTDYGLRFTVADITQLDPARQRQADLLGLPRRQKPHAQRFHKGEPGNPAGCPGLTDTSCTQPHRLQHPR